MSRGSVSLFTLIELLTVVSVMAALCSLLLPALGSARNSAKALKCASNHRQINTGMASYCGDSNGFFMPVGYLSGALPSQADIWTNLTSSPWCANLIAGGYCGGSATPSKWPNREQVFHCPADDTALPSPSALMAPGMGNPKRSCNIGMACVYDDANFHPNKIESVSSPSKSVALGEYFLSDAGNARVDCQTMAISSIITHNFEVNFRSTGGGTTPYGVTYCHSGLRADFSFIDGHSRAACYQQTVVETFKNRK